MRSKNLDKLHCYPKVLDRNPPIFFAPNLWQSPYFEACNNNVTSSYFLFPYSHLYFKKKSFVFRPCFIGALLYLQLNPKLQALLRLRQQLAMQNALLMAQSPGFAMPPPPAYPPPAPAPAKPIRGRPLQRPKDSFHQLNFIGFLKICFEFKPPPSAFQFRNNKFHQIVTYYLCFFI